MIQEILTKTYYGNTVKEWLFSLLIIFGAWIIAKISYWIFGNIFKKLTSRTKTKFDDILVDMIEEPVFLAFILVGVWIALGQLTLSATVITGTNNIIQFVAILNIAWFITRFSEAFFDEYLMPIAEKTETEFDDQLLPILKKGSKWVVWTLAIIMALNNAGYNVSALLAGLGIGGLAFAMAAKDTISNVFGGFTIFTDKPFKINDRIKINGLDGFVQEIGVRSTRLKTFDGTIITIPNSKFSESEIENVSLEPSRKVKVNLGLTYDTKPKDMDKAADILREIVKDKQDILTEDVIVSFNNFGDSALGILFIYYIKRGEDILAAQNDVNHEILKRFNKAGLDFAYPTQTIYTK